MPSSTQNEDRRKCARILLGVAVIDLSLIELGQTHGGVSNLCARQICVHAKTNRNTKLPVLSFQAQILVVAE